MTGFKGIFYHSLDSKFRMVVPAAFREGLGTEFVIMKSIPGDKCLTLYPLSEWEKLQEKLDNLPASEKNRKFYRWVFSRVEDCTMDPQNRINLREGFRNYAGIVKNIAIMGSGRKIEIWDAETFDALNAESDNFEVDPELIPF